MTDSPDWLPSADDVLELYARVIDLKGGTAGPPKDGCVERSLGGSITAALYSAEEEGAPDPTVVASYLLFYLARNHCFPDGNKRIAWVSCLDLLRRIGLDVEASDEEASTLVLGVAEGKVPQETIHGWFLAPERLTASVLPT